MTIQDQVAALPVGTRVRLTGPVENYPVVLVEAGESGTIAMHDTDSTWVTLDRHFPHLAEWENQLQVWHWPDDPFLPLAPLPEGMRACRFDFGDGAKPFPGFAHGTTWNGFDNVSILPETRDALAESLDDPGTVADLRALPCDAFGLVSLANGYATQIVEQSYRFEPVAPVAVEAVEAPSVNADSLGVAEAIREALACVLQSTLAPARRDAVASTLQALLGQRGCQGVPMGRDRLTDACDEAIFG